MASLTTLDRISATVAELTLDDPARRNALSMAMQDEIADHLEALANDVELKVLIVRANGPVFSAGFDLDELARSLSDDDVHRQLWRSSDRYHHALGGFPVFTIAAVRGPAIAGGFDLAVLCDLRVLADDAYLEHREHAFGDVVFEPLRELVGGAYARDLAFTGRPIDAQEAARIGLATSVVERDEVGSEALALAERVAQPRREVIVRMKRKALRGSPFEPRTPTLEL